MRGNPGQHKELMRFPAACVPFRYTYLQLLGQPFGQILRRFILVEPTGVVREMHHSTEFATDTDLLDRIMEKGIVIEVWDRVGLAGIDLTGMRVTVARLQLFTRGKNPPFRAGHFLKTKP